MKIITHSVELIPTYHSIDYDKCILVCANCHRELHWKTKGTR